MDCIPFGMTSQWLKIIFEKEGCVDDVFISKKVKKFRKEAFGFVRYTNVQDARRAITNLDGLPCEGRVCVYRWLDT